MDPVGILALQGGYDAHGRCLDQLNIPWQRVRCEDDLRQCGGLILPGGESTTHLKLLDRLGLAASVDHFIRSGKPTLATCAGLILAAKTVAHPSQPSFGWLDVDVSRNAWGRQVHSFETSLTQDHTKIDMGSNPMPVLFIRAPRLTRIGKNVDVIAEYEGEAIGVRSGAITGLTFHPELKGDPRFHASVFGR